MIELLEESKYVFVLILFSNNANSFKNNTAISLSNLSQRYFYQIYQIYLEFITVEIDTLECRTYTLN